MNKTKLVKPEPTYFIGINKSQTIQLSLYGLLMVFLAGAIFQSVSGQGGGSTGGGVMQAIGALVAFALALVMHEAVHGAFFKFYGGHPSYGAGITGILPYFYATSHGTAYTKNQMFVIGLSPFILLSVLFLVGDVLLPTFSTYFGVAFIANFSGAIGDIWLFSRLLRFDTCNNVTVVDNKAGLAVYSDDPKASAIARKLMKGDSNQANFGLYWAGGALGLFAFSMLAGLIGPWLIKDLSIGPSWLPLVSYHTSNHGVDWSLNLITPIIGGFVFAVFAKLFGRGRR